MACAAVTHGGGPTPVAASDPGFCPDALALQRIAKGVQEEMMIAMLATLQHAASTCADICMERLQALHLEMQAQHVPTSADGKSATFSPVTTPPRPQPSVIRTQRRRHAAAKVDGRGAGGSPEPTDVRLRNVLCFSMAGGPTSEGSAPSSPRQNTAASPGPSTQEARSPPPPPPPPAVPLEGFPPPLAGLPPSLDHHGSETEGDHGHHWGRGHAAGGAGSHSGAELDPCESCSLLNRLLSAHKGRGYLPHRRPRQHRRQRLSIPLSLVPCRAELDLVEHAPTPPVLQGLDAPTAAHRGLDAEDPDLGACWGRAASTDAAPAASACMGYPHAALGGPAGPSAAAGGLREAPPSVGAPPSPQRAIGQVADPTASLDAPTQDRGTT